MIKKRRDTAEQQMGKFYEEAPACACYNIRKAARAISQLYDDVLRPSGLRVTQFSILAVTRRLGPVTVTRLAEETVTDRTTLTRNLKILELQKLIRITPGHDRREREVTLTDRGRAALAQAHPFWKKIQAQVTQRLGPDRYRRLLSDLRTTVEVTQSG
ncbi:MAG: MarR family winged helix-turn-helix transcriptional regulator [Candidatus Methylomirabilales bacterium]